MLSSFWHWFVIVLTVLSVLGCWWLLQWTKGISNREGDDIGTTKEIGELNNHKRKEQPIDQPEDRGRLPDSQSHALRSIELGQADGG